MPLKIIKRGKFWHYSGSIAGRRLRGSCRTSQKETAERIATEVERRFWQSRFDGPAAVITFAQAAILYRDAEKPSRFLDVIEDYWRDTLIKNIRASAIRNSALALYPNSSPATRNRQVITPTQAIINHAAEMELCQRIAVKRFPTVKKEARHVNRAWIDTFMRHASPHLAGLALFMFTTGARISEALAVEWSDIDMTMQTVKIRQTKTSTDRTAALTPEIIAVMANLDKSTRPFRYASRWTATKQWHRVTARANIAPLTPHACRHGFATTMLQSGVDAVTVAKFGGWKSPVQVLATYGHASENTEIIRQVFAKKSNMNSK